MCDETLRRDRYDKKRNNDRDEFYADTSIITRKSFLRFVKGHPREEYAPPWPAPHSCVYPKANAYYAFHEDTNPFTRFPSKCESRKYGNVQPHFEPPKEPYKIRDPYRETEAREKYLGTNPTCFVILGKPGLNTAKLATMIAESWNCVLISPLSLINYEIERNSEKGKTMVDILKTGEFLGPEFVMNLVADRVNKRDVFHRGYIVEGLPLISNETLDYSSYYSSDNPRDKSHLQNIFDSSFRATCGAANEKASNNSQETLETKRCITRSNDEHCISSQVEEIFTTWPIKPSIIINATCPDADVARKREQFRLDPITGRVVDTSLAGTSKNIEILFSRDRMEYGANVSFELYQDLMNEERILDENQRKYLLRRPSDEKSNVEAQCALYKRFAVPVIEKWILLHNPQYVIRVDGRTPVSSMFQIVVSRLRVLSIPRAIIPKRFSDDAPLEFEGESPVTLTDEFEGKSNEEAFQNLMDRETISPLFPWRLSTWNFLCPVELARGRTTMGAAKYAVRFMNQIFFLSSAVAADLFVENPRTFLFPFSPRPTCKIAVFGPKYSGKSDLCSKLSRILRGTVINTSEIERGASADVDSDTSFYLSIQTASEEKCRNLVTAIESVPKEEVDVEVWRDGGYIVDGMFPDIDCWKIVAEDSGIIFEDAVLLFDEDPYERLLSNWRSIHGTADEEKFEGEHMEHFEDEEGEEETQGLIEYLKHIQKFELDWKRMRENVADTCRNLIVCNIGKIDDISSYVMNQIKDRYAEKARIMSENEKERERDLAEYIAMTDTENIEEEEEEMEDKKEAAKLNVKEDNRRFGDTNYYCPVALLKHNVFWKGKEEFSAIFTDKIYHLSSASAVDEFLNGPQKLGLPLRKPLPVIPPLRVSVVGPTGSGKSTLADAISRECGLVHADYFNCFTVFMKSRGMPTISHRDVLVSPEDLLDEIELPEDLNDERYNSDTATVQTFVRSYWKVGSELPEKMRHECLLEFFKGLYDQTGVVLDQFPSCPEDVDIALKNYAVPEIVLELRCGKEKAFQRVLPELLGSWRKKLEEKKRVELVRYTTELERYQRNRDNWIGERMLSRRRYFGENGNENEDDNEEQEYMEAEVTELTRFELEEIWYQENPEPVLFADWEDFETAKERIQQELQDKYENDSQKVDAIRNALQDESIPYIAVNAEGDAKEVLQRVLRILEPYVRRDVSILEKTYTVDPETAYALLDCGYYLASSFGRWCPVQLHENKIPLQMFLPFEAEQEIYTVIHRQFIYFLGGKDAQIAFSKNPLFYLEQDSCIPIVPFRLSIVGPPKCGKTTLAKRFARKYGVKVITRGAALRHVAKRFPWTESARSMESRLRAGQISAPESVHRAVEMYSIDPRSISQGFVLDGFPLDRKEYEELTFLGLQPMIVLDLKASLAFSLECLSREVDETKKPPNFSDSFLARRYAIWEVDREGFREWLKNFAQNVIELDATKCKWYVWSRADRKVCSRYTSIRSYFRESDYDKVHSLRYMSVSPYEFRRRQSRFEAYCPVCLYSENVMKISAPPRHQGMVQFREHFYWICPRHINEFIKNPQSHLPPINTAQLPEDRPRILTEAIDLEHACWSRRLQVEGFCLVTYVENLPNRKLVPGNSTIGIIYRDKVYLFCTENCRDRFFGQPAKYASIDIKNLRTLPPVSINDLPNVGFLEQTVAKLIIQAVNQISVARPKLPGLSASVTAAIYIGVYLKAHNGACPLKDDEVYKTVGKRMFSFERVIKVATRSMKKRLNPFVPAPVHRTPTNPGIHPYRLTGQFSALSRIFTRTSNSIVFRRTSPTQVLVDPSDNESSSDD
ncbi:adenylate kinase 9-like [Xylocopa sonorina]|uniref:adenylate kinase 9-like n=1 Tax=Xylocopa sonorina TaxID=1818115 RepID=UPI00403AEBFD